MGRIWQYIKRAVHFIRYGQPVKIEQRVVANIVNLNPNELLKGKTVLITGGTSGIGYAIARAMINAGAEVVITSRSAERAKFSAEKLQIECNKNSMIHGYEMDVRDISKFDNSIIEILSLLSTHRIDVLVNNAGIGGGDISTTSEEEYDTVMNTNLKSSFFLSRIVAKQMIENEIKGHILNIASSSSLRPANSAYILSKWGIRALTEGLARGLIKYGIVVNGLAPGSTATPMLKRDNNNLYRPDNLIKRFITVEEIANMAVILVSNLSQTIVGDIVYMTGGSGNITNDDFNYEFHF